ncbi:MAG TPA: F0F1 ATP synthase subunit B [Capsulimonadaceae bacterium]|jgi:F-type H+-transporting ATPase subunit b
MHEFLESLAIDPLAVLTQIVGFLVLLGLVKRFGLSPLFKVLDDRQAEIKATYDQLDADREAMLATRKQYEERLANIEAQAREQIASAVKEAQELRANIIADAQKHAETTLEKGRAEAERERQAAFLHMRQQIVDLSMQAASKVINESLDAKKHQKLVDDFISSVGTPSGGSASGTVGNA